MIRLEGVGARGVLHEVTLDVHAGEVLALVGPNGAGKSTLLSVMAGDLTHTGRVELQGRPVRDLPPRELARLRAVLPQSNAVSFGFSVRDVVAMGRAPWGDDDAAVITRSLELARVDHLATRAVTRLSGGERARVHLARVLAQDTSVLLLDEPTAALDLRHVEHVLAVARAQAAAGRAVVVVLHDLDLAASYADRTAVLHEGRLVHAGPGLPPAELLSDVYGHRVEVITHPRTGRPIVLAVRD